MVAGAVANAFACTRLEPATPGPGAGSAAAGVSPARADSAAAIVYAAARSAAAGRCPASAGSTATTTTFCASPGQVTINSLCAGSRQTAAKLVTGPDTVAENPLLNRQMRSRIVAAQGEFSTSFGMHDRRTKMKRRPLTLAICMLGACVASANPERAAAADIARHWIGIYYYENDGQQRPVEFEMRIDSATANTFIARTRETATFGSQPCPQLTANVSGQFTAQGIGFIKTYDGACAVNHSVRYQGTFSYDQRSMKGMWNIGPTSGQFTAEAAPD